MGGISSLDGALAPRHIKRVFLDISIVPEITDRVSRRRVQSHGTLTKLYAVGALSEDERHAHSNARAVRPSHARPDAARAAREELPDDMRLLDGGARIEKNDHLQHRQAQTSTRIAQGGLSEAKRGHGKKERTRTRDRVSNASPPAAALSSLVLHRDGEEGCAAAGEGHRRAVQQLHAPTQTSCAATSRLPAARLGHCVRAAPSPKSHGSRLGSTSEQHRHARSCHCLLKTGGSQAEPFP